MSIIRLQPPVTEFEAEVEEHEQTMLRLSIFLLCVSSALTATCNLRFDPRSPGIFTRKFGSHDIILDPTSGTITFDSSILISGYCANGFRSYSSSDTTLRKELIFECQSNGYVYYRLPNSSSASQVTTSGSLNCQWGSAFYEADIRGCSQYGLAYGFLYNSTISVIADACFNLNTMQIRFIHYVAASRTLTLDSYNTFPSLNMTDPPVIVEFDKNDIKNHNTALTAAVKNAMPQYSAFVEYEMLQLIPLDASLGVLSFYGESFGSVDAIPWWTALKFGNWRSVEKAIVIASVSEPLDVYAGMSGIVNYPTEGFGVNSNRLTYKVNQFVRYVPLYVWNYVKQHNNASDDGVVIVGINSPFFSGNGSEIFCNDICDSIPWLTSLKDIRKIPTLGYVFCCEKDDISAHLDGFPNLGAK